VRKSDLRSKAPLSGAGAKIAAMPIRREHRIIKRFAWLRYGSHPNVLAVGIGAKFTGGSPGGRSRVPGVTCIQFFVRRKRRSIQPRDRLPRFVYCRLPDGGVDRRRRMLTDVIAVGGIRAACGAGSLLDSNPDHGLVTLIFRNKAEPRRPVYLVSCAHVAGDIRRTPPAYDGLTVGGSAADPFARTLANTTAQAGEVDFDIALARVENAALPVRELRVRDEPLALESFYSPGSIQQGLSVSAVLRSHSTHGTVDSVHATAEVAYGRDAFQVHNLCGVAVEAAGGDSGGLIYREAQAVGIVVAASPEGWLWFQPLEPAIARLEQCAGFPIRVFGP
jgi:hypothetical protein